MTFSFVFKQSSADSRSACSTIDRLSVIMYSLFARLISKKKDQSYRVSCNWRGVGAIAPLPPATWALMVSSKKFWSCKNKII